MPSCVLNYWKTDSDSKFVSRLPAHSHFNAHNLQILPPPKQQVDPRKLRQSVVLITHVPLVASDLSTLTKLQIFGSSCTTGRELALDWQFTAALNCNDDPYWYVRSRGLQKQRPTRPTIFRSDLSQTHASRAGSIFYIFKHFIRLFQGEEKWFKRGDRKTKDNEFTRKEANAFPWRSDKF